MKFLKIILWVIVCIYIFLCGFLYVSQDSLLYFPSVNQEVLQLIRSDKNIIEFSVQTSEGETVGRWTGSWDCMIFYVWGNAENTDYSLITERTWWKNCIFTTMNYRGYGASSGKPNETNMHEDSIHVFEKVYAHYKPKMVYIVGRSLWTNIAIHLSNREKDKVDKLVLITPYDSLAHVAKLHYPIFPVEWLIKDTFDSKQLAKNLSTPTLVFQASDDSVVPAISTKNLIQSFEKILPEVAIIPNTDHNSITQSLVFLRKIDEFLK